MELLKQQRAARRRQSTKLVNETPAAIAAERPDRMQLESLLERLRVNTDELRRTDDDIGKHLRDEELQHELQTAMEYEDKALNAMANLRTRIADLERGQVTARSGQAATSPTGATTASGIRLPKLQLVRFRGDLTTWGTFWEQFKGAVHDNASLSEAEKFHYLRSQLDGPAAAAISGLQATEECYADAIDVLTERFGDRKRIERDHLAKLRALPHVKNPRDVHGLRKFYDYVQSHVRGLKALGVSSRTFSSMLCEMILSSLPVDLSLDYQRQKKRGALSGASVNTNETEGVTGTETDKDDELKDILQFVRVEIETMEGVGLHDSKRPDSRDRENKPNRVRPPSSHVLYNGQKVVEECFFCGSKSHVTVKCNSAIPLEERKKKLAKDQRCFRCVKRGHRSRYCRSNIVCGTCKGRHATALCDPSWRPIMKDETIKEDKAIEMVVSSNSVMPTGEKDVMLQTFRAFAVNENRCIYFRGVIDGGSQRTFILEDLAKLLKLEVVGTITLRLNTFANAQPRSGKKCNVVRVRIRSQHSPTDTTLEAVVIPFVCNDLSPTIVNDKFVKDIELGRGYLADQMMYPGCPTLSGISFLLGADQMWRLVTGQVRRSRANDQLVAIETILGWTLQGPVSTKAALQEDSSLMVSVLRADAPALESYVTKFWDLEAIGIFDGHEQTAQRDDEVMLQYTNTVKRKEGRYVVSLPWKGNQDCLHDNHEIATTRLRNLARKLLRDGTIDEYDSSIRSYVIDGHAEKVNDDVAIADRPVYYMPHRGVVRESSTTTRLRIVFDASAHASGEMSLNEHLEKGPKLNCDLLAVLLRFRTYCIALIADIRKAFLQVEVDEKDRDALRFLWFAEKPEAGRPLPRMEVWRMTRVPFGTASPFLLSATLQHHLGAASKSDRCIAKELKESFYVDDLLTGTDNYSDAAAIYRTATRLLKDARMELQKWASNAPALEQLFSGQARAADESNLPTQDGATKVLGLSWNKAADKVRFTGCNVLEVVASSANTKRAVLQASARFFDPLGLLSPYTIRSKILFQKLWKDAQPWDAPLPEAAAQEWHKWCSELLELEKVSVDRFAMRGTEGELKRLQLHTFTDASPQAYGACAYLRAEDEFDNVSVSLLVAKARVSPIKEQSLPRLDLMAALIGARLARFIQTALQSLNPEPVFWCDSTIALAWVKSPPSKWKPFVGNRVQEIQALSNPDNWLHCPGTLNPADLLTRGTTVSSLSYNGMWFKGPQWLASALCKPEAERVGGGSIKDSYGDVGEERRSAETTTVHVASVKPSPLLNVERFSRLQTLLRVTAWVNRFTWNCRSKDDERKVGPLVATEIQDAENFWMKQAQNDVYSEELANIRESQKLPPQSKAASLRLRIDTEGLLRLEGRLHFAEETENVRHPVLLPRDHELTKLIATAAHQRVLHGGVQETLSEIRENYWIPKARQFVRKIIRQCPTCIRGRLKAAQAPTAPLPKERIRRSEPFEVVGIDFAGPLMVQTTTGVTKTYITLFTCAVTRAIHLELVPSLSTRSFLMALRRFTSRRGIPKTVYSDNAKTFHRAAKEVRSIWKAIKDPEVADFCSTHKITWRFIVELAPWWGGFWERMVKSVKICLKKVLGRQSLTMEEMTTVIAEVEGALNSRPLTAEQFSPDEPKALSPSHFLIGRRITTLPETQADLMLSSSKTELTRRWKHRQRVVDRFWDRWRKEYLLQLRSTHYGISGRNQLQENDIVIVDDPRTPRHLWKLARILQTHPGRDGHIRACTVRVAGGPTLRRPVQHLYPLECSADTGSFAGGEDVQENETETGRSVPPAK